MTMTREGSIAEKAVQDIINLIMSKELVPGDKLPSERDLADMLGVGRPAVREALKIADAFGIVNIKQYDGLYVAGAEPEKLSTPFKLRMDMGQFDLVQLFEMRRIFEVETIKLAAARITDEEIESRRPSGLRKTRNLLNSLAHRTTWLRSDFFEEAIRHNSCIKV